MSPTEKLALDQGRIPANIVFDEIRAWLAEMDADDHFSPLHILAEKASLSFDTLVTWLGQERPESIDFDDADRLFCVMRRHDLWRLKYPDYYYNVYIPGPGKPPRDGSKPAKGPHVWSTQKCPNGHERTPETTKVRKKTGKHECRLCARATAKRCRDRARDRVS